MIDHIAVLMPAYNERSQVAQTLASLQNEAAGQFDVTVFLVDDGSEPVIDLRTLPKATTDFRIVALRHALNLGQGAALETARQMSLREKDIAAFVTMDADGQHLASDAIALARAVCGGADIAFGNRFLGHSNVPLARAILLRAALLFEWALTGLRLTDAHNGLRAFSRAALERIPIRQCRMAHATEIKQRASRASTLVIVEVPVSLRYTRDSIAKGQRSLGALAIVHDLFDHYLFGEPET
ncbi:MAG: glycosyltransferase family 2 protein [Polyangiaceae bacterium]